MFYTVGQVYGAASFPIGKGYLIHNGMMSTDLGSNPNSRTDKILGRLAAGFLLATLRRSDTPPHTEWLIEDLLATFQNHLKSIVRPPTPQGRDGEKIVQDSIEDILKIKGFEYELNRQIPYSTGNRYVDFVVEDCNLALEAKLCNSADDESRIIEDINADITVYKTRYENIAFVVYDCGFIRNPNKFRADFEQNSPRVRVIVV